MDVAVRHPMENVWQYSDLHRTPCRIIEEERLWGENLCRVWLPKQDAVVLVPRSSLSPLKTELQPEREAARIRYVATAAGVAEAIQGSPGASGAHLLLAPVESRVIPLPHQLHALSRAVSGDRVRYLLADEVGLGKTIEAGLIMRELKLRGLVRRTLVVAPKGLAVQWASEMRTHFNEPFQLVAGEELTVLQKIQSGEHSGLWADSFGLRKIDPSDRPNPWTLFTQTIVSYDSVKPLEKRRGWSKERLDEYNRSRFEDLITAGWDLVIVDEAHRLGGSSEQVARYKLGRGLSEAAPFLLFLSATPHQGKSDAFHRLMNLLDSRAFPDMESVSRERVAPYVIRTEKRKAVNAAGAPLFKPRETRMLPVAWEDRHFAQRSLYEAVTEYVREGYNRALLEQKRHIGFLMLLMQRLVVSSTRAIRTTLERRLAVLQGGEQNTASRFDEVDAAAPGDDSEEFAAMYDMDGQELLDALLQSVFSSLHREADQVRTLLDIAQLCEQTCPDAKAEALIEWLYRLQAEENEPELKVLIFTEFVPTQQMLKEFLESRGISVVTLNGSMDMSERMLAQEAFRKTHRALVSTDAGGEGLNLQFAHVVINYDIPWNPMRLEQRIGRVDRIGQSKTVRAINFVFENSVEFRVREVLERKLAVIFQEFGIDKTGDVLDSARAGEIFEDLFASVILDSDDIENVVEQRVAAVRDEIREARNSSAVYGISEEPDMQVAEQLRSHPLPHWVERMTTGYLESHGGEAVRRRSCWSLRWPDGREERKCVFTAREAERMPDAALLNLENDMIRGLALNVPQTAIGMPVPCVGASGIPSDITGLWGLFEIRLRTETCTNTSSLRIPPLRRAYFSVFASDEGKLFLPTARHILDVLRTEDVRVHGALSVESSLLAVEKLREAAERAGRESYEALRQEHFASLAREEARGSTAFASRRNAIERVGLPEVRRYRLARCDTEEAEWRAELRAARRVVPEIRPLLHVRIGAGGAR